MFTVDLDLISIQLRHAVNAKREATVFCRSPERTLVTAQMDVHHNPMRLTSNDISSCREEELGEEVTEQ